MATQKKLETPLKGKSDKSPSPTQAKAKKSSTSTTEKPLPSYLKPTVSSSGHVDHQHPNPKKALTYSSNPSITRRRSLEKLPSSSSSSPTHKSPIHVSLGSSSTTLLRRKSSPKLLTKMINPSSSTKINPGVKKTKSLISLKNEKETKIDQVDDGEKNDETISVNDVEKDEKLDELEVPNVENPSNCEDVKACDLHEETENSMDVKIEGVDQEKELVEEEVVLDDRVIEKKREENEMKNEIENEDTDEKKDNDVAKNGEIVEMVSKKEDVTSEIENVKVEGAKKEDQQHVQYNDVIEETKNKLMEKRKNKVKALVGAFETVISLEEA